jgi:periplasmic divalent cation tolerance protein
MQLRCCRAGLTSIYWWDGKVNKDAELLLIIKTQNSLVPKLAEVVKSKHPYEECEVISTPITGGRESYIQWIRDSTT